MSNSDQSQAGSPSTAKKTNATEGSSRWWQFYLVRYATGTAIGAVVFYFLWARAIVPKCLLFNHACPSDTTIVLDAAHLILLAAYGLAYCYIASSPFLVFQAGRFLLRPHEKRTGRATIFICVAAFVVCIIGSTLLALACLHVVGFAGFMIIWCWGACILALLVWLLQWLVVWCTVKDADPIYDFYKNLARRRGTGKVENGEIVESYRHLREHGNALWIVLLEVMLGAALIRVASVAPDETKLSLLAVLLAVWIAPGALVWLIGTLIELRFSEDTYWLG